MKRKTERVKMRRGDLRVVELRIVCDRDEERQVITALEDAASTEGLATVGFASRPINDTEFKWFKLEFPHEV